MPSSRRPARLSIAGRRHERLPGLELVTTRTVFSSTLMYRLHWMRYLLGRSGYFWQFCLLSLLVLGVMPNPSRTDERTGCMFLLLYFCLLLRRACSGCVLYIPTCLSVEAYMLLAVAGQMDGWIPPPPPRDTRRRRRQEGDENGEEMHNTYLPTYLLTYPYVWSAFCQDLAHCSTYTHPPRCASRRDTPPPQCTPTNCEMTSCVSPVDNLPIAIQDVMGCTR